MEPQLHVGMLTNSGFAHDWADAAARVATVSRFEVGRRSGRPDVTTVARVRLRPSRYLFRVNSLIDSVILERAIGRERRILASFDVLHGHFFADSRPLVRVSSRLCLPLIVTEHSPFATRQRPARSAALARARWVYQSADAVIAVSNHLARGIEQLAGRPCEVVGNPVDVDLFAPRSVAPPRSSESAVKLICVGRLVPEKRVDLLLDALTIARKELNLELSIVGEGPERLRLERQVADSELTDSVTFHGHRPRRDVAELVSRSDVGVSASAIESFGMAVAEFSSAGIPVIAPAQAPFDEVLPSAGRVLFEPGSVQEFARSIAQVAETNWDSRKIRSSIVSRFSPAAISLQLADIYTALA